MTESADLQYGGFSRFELELEVCDTWFKQCNIDGTRIVRPGPGEPVVSELSSHTEILR